MFWDSLLFLKYFLHFWQCVALNVFSIWMTTYIKLEMSCLLKQLHTEIMHQKTYAKKSTWFFLLVASWRFQGQREAPVKKKQLNFGHCPNRLDPPPSVSLDTFEELFPFDSEIKWWLHQPCQPQHILGKMLNFFPVSLGGSSIWCWGGP